mgnify:CR=1 FL=1
MQVNVPEPVFVIIGAVYSDWGDVEKTDAIRQHPAFCLTGAWRSFSDKFEQSAAICFFKTVSDVEKRA